MVAQSLTIQKDSYLANKKARIDYLIGGEVWNYSKKYANQHSMTFYYDDDSKIVITKNSVKWGWKHKWISERSIDFIPV